MALLVYEPLQSLLSYTKMALLVYEPAKRGTPYTRMAILVYGVSKKAGEKAHRVTAAMPEAEAACTAGSYMASATAEGSMYRPS